MSRRQAGSLASRIDAFDCVTGDYGELTALVVRRLMTWRVPAIDADDLAQGLVLLAYQTGSLPCQTVDRAAWAWLKRRQRAKEIPFSQLDAESAAELYHRPGHLEGSILRLDHPDAPRRPEQAQADVDSWDAIRAALATMRARGWALHADRLAVWIADPGNPPALTQMQRKRTIQALRRALLPILIEPEQLARSLKRARRNANHES